MSRLVWQPGGSPRVLLLHGVTSSAQVWWQIGSRLGNAGVESVAVDLRGHGASPRTETYLMDDFVSDVEHHLADTPGYDLIVGHSLGGVIATLADTGEVPLFLIDPPINTEELPGFADDILAERNPSLEDIVAQHPGWHPEDVYWKWWSSQAITEATLQRWVIDCVPWDITSALAGASSPTRLVVADHTAGGLILPSQLDAVITNPMITFHDLPGLCHSPHRDQPQLVLDLIFDQLGLIET